MNNIILNSNMDQIDKILSVEALTSHEPFPPTSTLLLSALCCWAIDALTFVDTVFEADRTLVFVVVVVVVFVVFVVVVPPVVVATVDVLRVLLVPCIFKRVIVY